MPEQPGLGRQRQTPLTLVQMREQNIEPSRQLTADLVGYAHTTSTTSSPRSNALFLDGFGVVHRAGTHSEIVERLVHHLRRAHTADVDLPSWIPRPYGRQSPAAARPEFGMEYEAFGAAAKSRVAS
jgi:hypothetical protein